MGYSPWSHKELDTPEWLTHRHSALHDSALPFCLDSALPFCLDLLLAAAAAAAKSLQSCPTLCNPTDGSPSGSPVPGILQARTLEWVAISFSSACK